MPIAILSENIIKIDTRILRVVLVAAAIVCVIAAFVVVKWLFANAVASSIDLTRPEARFIAEGLTEISPADPTTHHIAAIALERTFDPVDLERAIYEYGRAVELAPYNFNAWLNLAKARSLTGDMDGADAAFRRSMELAPNYSVVQWAYGNFLIRQGRTDEGFSLVTRAAASMPEYSTPAATIALEIFNGEIESVRRSMGDSQAANSALAMVLTTQGRHADAFAVWEGLPADDKVAKYGKLTNDLIGKFIEAHQYGLAAKLTAGFDTPEHEKPVIGRVNNGSFDHGVKLRQAGMFEWQIGDGTHPQAGLSESQTHSGKYSLQLIFSGFETEGFRSISQLIAVEPGRVYDLELFYRSDLTSNAHLKWEVTDAVTKAPLAATDKLGPSATWSTITARFVVPATTDGVVIRLIREGCIGPACPMSGRVTFDDVSIREVGQ